MADGGHIRTRKTAILGADPLWSERRVWSRAEAWMYVLAAAEPTGPDKWLFSASLRELAILWSWSKGRTERFFAWLEGQKRLTKQQTSRARERDTYLVDSSDICGLEWDSSPKERDSEWDSERDSHLSDYTTGYGKSRDSKRDSKRDTPPSSPPHTPPLTPTPLFPDLLSASSAPNGSGIRSTGVVGSANRLAALKAELDWRIEEAWGAYLRTRERFFVQRNGAAPKQPVLTKEIRAAIRAALEEHDHGRLGAEDRPQWKAESPVRAAGIGLFLSPWHTAEDPRNESRTLYLEPWRPWKHQRGKPDPVPGFAQLYFDFRSRKERKRS